MKIFLTHTFQTTLKEESYTLIREVMKLLYDNHHEIYLGGLLINLKDTLIKYADAITCYSVEAYKEEKNNCPLAKYILVEDGFMRTKTLCSETDCVILTPGGTGSLAEFFSILEEYRYQKNNKKIYILNDNHYYDDLLNGISRLIDISFNNMDTLKYIEEVNLEQLKIILKEGI